MFFSTSNNVSTTVSSENENELHQQLLKEFRGISLNCREENGTIVADSINASFGSILRKDTTVVTVTPSRRGTGYTVEAATTFKPSFWFWGFVVLDVLLLTTLIGFVIGMAATLGLYFHNQKLVKEAIDRALQNTARSMA